MSRDVIERFCAKVAWPDDVTGCWLWTAYRNRDGYGRFGVAGRVVLAHRVAYELSRGPIPAGLQIDHLCRTPACVNPEHMEAVTNRTNVLRGAAPSAVNAVKTHCPKGHAYDDENTHIESGGRRRCRKCRQDRDRTGEYGRWPDRG